MRCKLGRLGVLALVLALSGPVHAQADLSGTWTILVHEDVGHRVDNPALAPGIPGTGGPQLGDYTGLPLNEAARRRADSWDASILLLPEHQTQPATAAYFSQVPTDLRISAVVDARSQQLVALQTFQPLTHATRTIWMDGRPHPPEYAAHSWQGFSTGTWQGDTLVVETTHMKAGFLDRNGVPHSDRAALMERFIRHGDTLTVVSVLSDRVYLDEPLVRSASWVLNRIAALSPVAPAPAIDEFPGQRRGAVPHHLPGTNPFLREFAGRAGLPFEATRGGAETTYPEYQIRLEESRATTRPASVP